MKKNTTIKYYAFKEFDLADIKPTDFARSKAIEWVMYLNQKELETNGSLDNFYYIDSSTATKINIQVFFPEYTTRINDPQFLERIEALREPDLYDLRKRRGASHKKP